MFNWEDALVRADKSLAECGPVKALADLLKLKPVHVFAVSVVFTMGFLLYGLCGQFICTVTGLAYPAFESFKAIESREQSQMQLWLTYWTVFAAINVFEAVAYYLLVWFPFYYPIKFALLVWLFSPATRGAESVYRTVLAPLLEKNRHMIDRTMQDAKREASRSLSGLPMAAASLGAEAGRGALQAGITLKRNISESMPMITTTVHEALSATDVAKSGGEVAATAGDTDVGAAPKAKEAKEEAEAPEELLDDSKAKGGVNALIARHQGQPRDTTEGSEGDGVPLFRGGGAAKED